MPSPSLTEGLALIESTSISMQQLMHHVPLKRLVKMRRSEQSTAHLDTDYELLQALANFEDIPENQTSRAAFDAALRKAEEEYEGDKVTHCNHYIQEAIAAFEVPKPLLKKTFEDVAVEQDAVCEINQVLPSQDVDVSNDDVELCTASPPSSPQRRAYGLEHSSPFEVEQRNVRES
ncbi:uncharacterized protein EAE97_006767 [Botrytis byssoidea]|uniref:Uncharacterized protein n=1 Tax=Botrytis byssoidea TaxID=139641 RepID=A0A9P5IIB3_9HELO|nr:uncharacterized protein EAE97_006767 [Botrytis byssoidea]KAF7941930.1 hypothetical protein EAE97_006767 [Botrytis byssoidea]